MIISLNTLHFDSPLQQTGECILLTELILPRNGIARKVALKELRINRGHRSLARAPFYEKGIFKEKVDGLVGLKVSVTRPLKHSEWTQFARQLLSTGIESTSELLRSAWLSHAVLEDLMESGTDQLADRIAEDEPQFIASGGIDLDSEQLVSGPVTIPLRLNQRLRNSETAPGPKSREQRKISTQHYRKGSPIGELSMDLLLD
ncbi:hypothetical protein QEH59_14290 [Coraliomargarita sp. SDUM461004]|uniref:Uncharacterized protein n=1 Tax=Thalassobacterium sedimentorum TaxID=3041258 RepID=A0ABU1ALJ1_9BACT|nr:hypothetical protein [Coraliomargarita sp. SDUM461004]MDQ8195599.1 hypothetical protein [Coraliomargarita sp. SDUM461004]